MTPPETPASADARPDEPAGGSTGAGAPAPVDGASVKPAESAGVYWTGHSELMTDVRSERVLLTTNVVAILLSIATLASVGHPSPLYAAVFYPMIVVNATPIVYRYFHSTYLQGAIMGGWLLCAAVVNLGLDWIFVSQGMQRNWPMLIVICDCATVFHVSPKIVNTTLVLGLVWLAVCKVDDIVRFGLVTAVTDIPMLCDCPEPPCKVAFLRGAFQYAVNLFFLLVPVLLTRYYVSMVRSEKRTMEACIDTARQLATDLALFDLDAADALLDGDDEQPLPPALKKAFADILYNLRTYKPYLPRSCLPLEGQHHDSDEGGHESESPLRSQSPVPPSLLVDPSAVLSAGDSSSRSNATDRSGLSRATQSTGGVSVSHHPLAGSHAANAVVQRPRTSRVTLVQTNLHDTLRMCDAGVSVIEKTFEAMISKAVEVFHSSRGIVDLFLGDRIFASFNASRPCVRHATSGVAASKAFYEVLEGPPVGNIAVVSGSALCGDLGSEHMRRYTIMGRLPLVAFGMERIGRELGVPVVCNTDCQRDACSEHAMRLYPQLVTITRQGFDMGPSTDRSVAQQRGQVLGSTGVYLWEVALPRDALRCAGGSVRSRTSLTRGGGGGATRDDWMYEAEVGGASKWDTYNEGVKLFLKGVSSEDAIARCGVVGHYVKHLRRALEARGGLPPVHVHYF
eukprot:Rhum_TRINITY_DN8671_c0_g1::Rhum_TRINITY_DN8671_c0_g1_i1::g.29296::m.29296